MFENSSEELASHKLLILYILIIYDKEDILFNFFKLTSSENVLTLLS